MIKHSIIKQHIKTAIKTATLSTYLGFLAILVFCVFGTLASMAKFKDSILIYYAFHFLPYVLISLSIPLSLHHLFLLWRYRIIQLGIIMILLIIGLGSLLITVILGVIQGAGVAFFMSLFLTMISWFGMPFLFKVNFKKFLAFLNQ